MKILFVSALLPYPLYSGGQVRIYNLLKAMSKQHEITLFSFIREPSERAHTAQLDFCKKITLVHRGHAWQPQYIGGSLLSQYPFLWSTYNSRQMRQKIQQELASAAYDLIHIEPGYVWPAIPATPLPVVVTEHNIEHTIYEGYVKRFPIAFVRPLLSIDVAKMRRCQTNVWQRTRQVITVTPEDKKVVQSAAPNALVSVISNGVNLKAFPFHFHKGNQVAPVFLFVGNFSWMQNRDALTFAIQEIWPTLYQRYPKATLHVVGKDMSHNLELLIQQPGVIYRPHVSEIAPEFQNADILLAPLRIGGGTKFKILEAMASGLPVVTTTMGASGLPVGPGKELMVADSTEDMARAIHILLTDERARETMAMSARKLIETNYSWEQIARKLNAVWNEAYEKHN